jgi:uncharacterized SAM-binding protein YcdF (DUF218 family)
MSLADEIDTWARCLADYQILSHQVEHADCILGLGTNDTRVAERAADLYLEGWAPKLVFSGHVGPWTQGLYPTTEAEHFAGIAMQRGVPAGAILIEPEATNTGENIVFTRRLLEWHDMLPRKILLVQKPYMERRAFATFARFWPDCEVVVTSPRIGYDDYPLPWLSKAEVIHIMVGDVHRIMVYPERGFQIAQPVPDDVKAAFEALVAAGYDRHLVPGAR